MVSLGVLLPGLQFQLTLLLRVFQHYVLVRVSRPQQLIIAALLLFEIGQRHCLGLCLCCVRLNSISVVVAILWLDLKPQPCRRVSRLLCSKVRIATSQSAHNLILAVIVERGLIHEREQIVPSIVSIEYHTSGSLHCREHGGVFVDWLES